jgi:DNA-binding LytR/AlgR family response regulator
MNALIVEDEALSAQHLKTLLHKTAPEINVVNILDTVQDTVDYLKTFPAIDIIFLDVHLADGISFDIFQQVEVKQPIIFTTAYDEYAIKAFKVNSIDYLLKPIGINDVKSAINKFKTHHTPTPSASINHQQAFPIDYTMDALELIVSDKMFFRINRKMIVNIEQINQVQTYFNGRLKIKIKQTYHEDCIVSRERVTDFKRWLDQ